MQKIEVQFVMTMDRAHVIIPLVVVAVSHPMLAT